MGTPVIIYGKSGSGKSASTENMDREKTLYINVENKPLPYKGKFKYNCVTDSVPKITEQLKKMSGADVKTAVIDDCGLIMTHLFMANHRTMKGGAQFDLYNEIADKMYEIISVVKTLPEDNIVYIVLHEETDDYGNTKVKTIGKLLDQKCPFEERVTIMLRAMSADGRHFFRTKTTGNDITKSPKGMFEQDEIPNDLAFVDKKIREYYEI